MKGIWRASLMMTETVFLAMANQPGWVPCAAHHPIL